MLDPNGSGDQVTFLVITNGLVLFLTIIIGAVASVVQSGTIAFLYIDRRIRTEALDLDLQRAVEAREGGHDAADPYLPADTVHRRDSMIAALYGVEVPVDPERR